MPDFYPFSWQPPNPLYKKILRVGEGDWNYLVFRANRLGYVNIGGEELFLELQYH